MPPKPQEQQKEDEMSYTSQLRRLGQLPDEKPENTIQKKYERRIRLRKIREATSNSEKDGEGATKLGCPKSNSDFNISWDSTSLRVSLNFTLSI